MKSKADIKPQTFRRPQSLAEKKWFSRSKKKKYIYSVRKNKYKTVSKVFKTIYDRIYILSFSFARELHVFLILFHKSVARGFISHDWAYLWKSVHFIKFICILCILFHSFHNCGLVRKKKIIFKKVCKWVWENC